MPRRDGGTPTFQRTLLQYDNPRTQHTIDWTGFKPGAAGAERNYLYVTTGDGGMQADVQRQLSTTARTRPPSWARCSGWTSTPPPPTPTPRRQQELRHPRRQPLRLRRHRQAEGDVHDRLPQPVARQLRPADRRHVRRRRRLQHQGGDQLQQERRRLHRRPRLRLGLREGTIANPVAGDGGPSPGSLNPIYEVDHNDFNSITGGYVYRGPVPELQGKYFFADFVTGKIFALEFDRDTDPPTFNGSTAGITDVQDMTAGINGLIAANGGGGPITFPVSFGEDHAGNLYIVSIGTATSSTRRWAPASIYTIVPEPTGGALLLASLVTLARRPTRRRRR